MLYLFVENKITELSTRLWLTLDELFKGIKYIMLNTIFCRDPIVISCFNSRRALF